MFRYRPFQFAVAAVLIAGLLNLPAAAESKDMVQLQTQIQGLQDSVARLQQSNDERMGVLKDLVQQSADSVNKMSAAMDALTIKMQAQQDALSAKSDTVSGQIQSLNDSLDELKARMARLEKSLGDIQGQMSSVTAVVNNIPQTTGTPASPAPATAAPPADAPARSSDQALPSTDNVVAPIVRNGGGASAPVGDMYRAAYNDYMSAKYVLASSEFNDLAVAYPDDNLSGNAYFYMGEIALRTAKPSVAVKDYDHLLERYPDNVKIPAAHLHKGEALMAVKQNDAAAREFKTLIQRFPNSPEAAQAHSKLAALSARR